jgi:hypothetical protein
MSIIDQANHSVVKYDPKTSKPFTGQRLAKVTYKTINDKDNPMYGIKRDSQCVSIPMIAVGDIRNNLTALEPHVIEYLQSVQDKIIREKIDAGSKSISTEEISVASMIEWLESNNESGRLTKESVGKWFDESIGEMLAVVLADKLGVSSTPSDKESAQIMAVVGTFKDKVSSLAGGKTSYEPKMCDSLIKCLELAPAGDALASRFMVRLNKMKEDASKNVDLIDLL